MCVCVCVCVKFLTHNDYRREALKHHPDKNNADPEAETRFKRVLAAYECITKPEDEFEPSIYDDMDEEALYKVFSR